MKIPSISTIIRTWKNNNYMFLEKKYKRGAKKKLGPNIVKHLSNTKILYELAGMSLE
jgi:hypothetical protein